jgi:gliding motility-associated lipoprotein GldD
MKRQTLFYVFILLLSLSACTENSYTPKPKGYFRISFPEKRYHTYSGECAFEFDYPVYAQLQPDSSSDAQSCWYNLSFSQFNGRLHLTYYDINSKKEFENLVEDSRTFAFKHTVKAQAINQKIINYPDKKVYGVYFAIEGNTASSVQFFLTDSAKHYFRGALYFYERPHYDSIQPVINFIKKDIDSMIHSFKWKN